MMRRIVSARPGGRLAQDLGGELGQVCQRLAPRIERRARSADLPASCAACALRNCSPAASSWSNALRCRQ